MAALTTLARIKAIAVDDAYIQGLGDEDLVVTMVLEDVERRITEARWGARAEEAQRYLAAHLLSLANQPVGGRGPLSSESVGGVSQSFTLPWLNRETVLGGTQFGLNYLRIRDEVFAAFDTVLVG